MQIVTTCRVYVRKQVYSIVSKMGHGARLVSVGRTEADALCDGFDLRGIHYCILSSLNHAILRVLNKTGTAAGSPGNTRKNNTQIEREAYGQTLSVVVGRERK